VIHPQSKSGHDVEQRTIYSQKPFEKLGEGKGHELGARLGAHQVIDGTLASG